MTIKLIIEDGNRFMNEVHYFETNKTKFHSSFSHTFIPQSLSESNLFCVARPHLTDVYAEAVIIKHFPSDQSSCFKGRWHHQLLC